MRVFNIISGVTIGSMNIATVYYMKFSGSMYIAYNMTLFVELMLCVWHIQYYRTLVLVVKGLAVPVQKLLECLNILFALIPEVSLDTDRTRAQNCIGVVFKVHNILWV